MERFPGQDKKIALHSLSFNSHDMIFISVLRAPKIC